ncbi:GAF domain-containing sensor histidine kinase [Planomonospora sp. ID67723]|uniref:GAF domain-containing sensor histidine kinase n=1 Tax=Planomonospora sp. ID67723 TaxID=2738134 RepID=UPI0018C4439B|nr:GAF domain-containing sensor histidine kinase [Planomonospora sp. ID67723]MBG0826633.1 GAF domain-containing sensor histidine kinase [Planomonospora sp. ID67723]
MTQRPVPPDEAGRMREIETLGALERVDEPRFSAIAELAALICQAPMALVSIIGAERQHFKGRVGVTETGMDRWLGFCSHVIIGRRLLEVPDTLADPRFRDDPAVTGEPYVRFYAGAPVTSTRGYVLGTVCVMDRTPRRLNTEQHQALDSLATCAADLLQLHHYARQSQQVITRLAEIEELKHGFLRTVSHELRTPLTSIGSYLQLIQEGGLDADTEHQFLDVIERNSDRIRGLIDELLLLASLSARTASYSPALIDLTDLARRACTQAAAKAWANSLTLAFRPDAQVTAWGDTGRLCHALDQALDNAIKFTPSGGSVTVTADPGPVVEVCDTGIGISAEDLPHVFDDFYRAAEAEDRAIGGTGLGLPIMEKIAHLHGGEVHIASTPGEGTCVRLTLPAPPAAPGKP